jgi:N-acetylneuraminate synthase
MSAGEALLDAESSVVKIGSRSVGGDHPSYLIGEIGINHNGDLQNALELMRIATDAGFDAVKFQKRQPSIAVPEHQKSVERETPWGTMTYLEYKERVEFWKPEFDAIATLASELGIDWFASPWDLPSVDFLGDYDPVCFKVASASITDMDLLDRVASFGRPVIISTGMSTMEEIRAAVGRFDPSSLLIAHATSTYPCPPNELNLRMIHTLAEEFAVPIGYSGHETGLQTSVAAVVVGAKFVERHITLDRTMWGTDQSASVEPAGMQRLVRDIRVVEAALGDGIKRVYESEVPIRAKLRG